MNTTPIRYAIHLNPSGEKRDCTANRMRDRALAAIAAATPPAQAAQPTDAARYQWLRKQKAPACHWPIPSLITQGWRPTPEEIDEAIDAAIAASKGAL